MHNLILKEIDNIKNDFENGSSVIAKNAADVFTKIVDEYPEDRKRIIKYAEKLKNAKPSMAALQSIVSKCIVELDKMTPPFSFEEKNEYIKKLMEKAKEVCIENTVQELLKKNNFKRIATCTYSSTAAAFFKNASEEGFEIKVNAVESIWRGKSYGKKTVDFCKKHKVPAELFPDNKIEKTVLQSDVFLIGADSFKPKKGAVNGVPSRLCAETCSGKIPFYVIAESFKEIEKIITEDGFEFIPATLIKEILSENNF